MISFLLKDLYHSGVLERLSFLSDFTHFIAPCRTRAASRGTEAEQLGALAGIDYAGISLALQRLDCPVESGGATIPTQRFELFMWSKTCERRWSIHTF